MAEPAQTKPNLMFLIGPPRSGSTLLMRMLGSHSQVYAPDEPHLLTPLAHLGYYARVDQAPYDPVITRAAMHELVKTLPRGESDFLDAMRACTDTLYGRLLAPTGRRVVLDKTPAYALVLDFVAKLYPDARYVVLTRHPMAIWCSFVESFFDSDHETAHAHQPLLERYVPAIARFLRESPVPLHRIRYEELVRTPEAHMQALCAFADLPFEPEMVNYGEKKTGEDAGGAREAVRGLGDPTTVARETRPTTASLSKWASELSGQPAKIEQCQRILASLADEDLETWGHPRSQIEAELAAIDPGGSRRPRPRLTRYALERRAIVMLRRNIHHNAFGRLVRRIRLVCDLLLR